MAHQMQMELTAKRFEAPDETRTFLNDMGHADIVRIGERTASRSVFMPGWQWSQHVKPIAQTESCEVFHLGMVVSGRMRVIMDGGETLDLTPGDVFEIPPHHDAETIGDEACMMIDFGDMADYAKSPDH
jgi:mannose-6-phosphate isomerase-like protein (cupin superfamily)